MQIHNDDRQMYIDISFMTWCNADMAQETLPEYVTRIMQEKKISSYAVERYSRKAISQSHAYRISTGEVTAPSTEMLKALAIGLGIPESELFAVARGITEDSKVIANERLQTIGFHYDKLPKKKKLKVDYLIDVLERELQRLQADTKEL